MPTYFFKLGNTPNLSLLELEYLLSAKPELISSQLAVLQTNQELDIESIQQQAGGLVKSFLQLTKLQTNTLEEVETKIVDYLASQVGKITFSISALGDRDLPQIDFLSIKNQLRHRGLKVRYLESKNQSLSAAVLLHQNILELIIINDGKQLILAKTISIQNIDDWTKRDRQKPYADSKKGMLPPKVARIMVNIAQGLNRGEAQNQILYDPFCGSGNILIEALLTGFIVSGADLDKNSVEGTKENLAWIIDQYQLNSKFSVTKRDATQKFTDSTAPFIDVIVTEPFLGKPAPKEKELPNIFKGLYRTYLGAFKSFIKILKPNAAVVIILPLVETKNKTYDLKKLIDKLPGLGYTTVSQPVTYSRPQAIVKRQIIFLRFKG
ncbi:hypothetical protein KJ707_02950 [Patescibacteria group bacterium]|nr:hypothetical protein [Patescibacteria group bacterium]MBU1967117.1 hypothetical protein [Patescibacteria group bacterium]MBU2543494.1 hypothetical protein [Patescibacteria group bacterium]